MLSKAVTSILALASLASCLTIRQAPSSAACPYNYPVTLNNTESHNGLIFTIASNNPITKNRAVQLRNAPSSYGKNVQVAAIDATSPVLLGQLKGGAVYSENRSDVNQLYDLGPTGSLVKVADNAPAGTENATRYAFEFSQKKTPAKKFYLEAPSEDGTYGLYHSVPNGIANGFILCEQDKGTWYQLYYNTYVQNPPNRPGCEYVGVRVSEYIGTPV